MTQGPKSSGEQFSVSTTGSGFETVDLGSAGATPGATYGSSYNQPAGSTSGGVVDQAKNTASQVVDQAQQTTSQVVDQARGVATSRLAGQKDRAAEGLGSMAEALRQTGQQLREQDQAGVTDYVESAANQIERISGYLQNSDVGDLIDDVEHFARRQPALFLGGAFVLGLLGARFLKSSSRSSSRNYPLATRDTYSRSQIYGGGYQGGQTSYGNTGYGTTGATGYGTSGYGTTSGLGTTGTTAVPTGSGYGTGNVGTTGSTSTTGYGTAGTTTGSTGTTGYGTTGTTTGSTGTTTSNIDDVTGTRSVGGMEER